MTYDQGFLRRFRDPIRVPRIENWVPTIRENHHRVPRIKENRVPRIGEIGSLHGHIGYLTFSLKKNCIWCNFPRHFFTQFSKTSAVWHCAWENCTRHGV